MTFASIPTCRWYFYAAGGRDAGERADQVRADSSRHLHALGLSESVVPTEDATTGRGWGGRLREDRATAWTPRPPDRHTPC